MSTPFSSEHLSRIRDDARRLLARAVDHEDDLEDLVRSADDDVHQAEAALSQAFTGSSINPLELQRVHAAHLRRGIVCADAARRACVSARVQHVIASRLLTRLEGQRAGAPQGTGRRRPDGVLVVDDVADVRELVARVLRDAGFVVRTAANGLEALIAAYEMQPKVIVMDMTMPVLGGFEATRLIKATEGIAHTRVIAYTADPLLPDDQFQRLFAAVVTKPATPDDVLAAVQNVASL